MRQLDGEIAACLFRLPTREPFARAEQSRERHQAVVPVVIAGNRSHHGVRCIAARQGCFEWSNEPRLILRSTGDRVYRITTEDQYCATASELRITIGVR